MTRQKMKTRRISVLFVSVFVLILAMFVALIPFSATSNIAFASSSNGVVEDNIIKNNDFSSSDFWNASANFVTYSFGANGFTFNATSWSPLEYYDYPFALNTTYTIAFGLNNSVSVLHFTTPSTYSSFNVGDVGSGIYCRFYVYVGSDRFTLTLDFTNVSGVLHWIKCEVGSEFTGYVPKDYKNYGYNEGFSVGSFGDLTGFEVVSNLDTYGNDYTNDFYVGDTHYHGQLSSSSGQSVYNMPNLGGAFSSNSTFVGYSLGEVQYGFAISGWFILNYYSGSDDYPLFDIKLVSQSDSSILTFSSYDFQINKTFQYGTARKRYYLFDKYLLPTQSKYNAYICLNYNHDYGNAVPSSRYGNTLYYQDFNFYTYSSNTGDINSLYYEGFRDGFEDGKQSSYLEYMQNLHDYGLEQWSLGRDNGYQEGLSDGYNEGYEDAVLNNNDYTFRGLFTSLIDSPVRVIGSALDFEILGFNLKSFLFALLSIALVIFVIKLFI